MSQCRKLDDDKHMTDASRPHVICDAKNLLMDPTRMSHARCPKFRPGYLCYSDTYHHYAKGAFGLACALPNLPLEDFPKDHLRDIIDSIVRVEDKYQLQVLFSYLQAMSHPCMLQTHSLWKVGLSFCK